MSEVKVMIPPPIYAEDIVGDWFLSESDEKLVRTLFRGHRDMMDRYYGDPKGREDQELADEAWYWERAAHRIWREAGNADRPTWEIVVLITRKSGGEL